MRVRAYGEPFDAGAGGHRGAAESSLGGVGHAGEARNKHTQGTEIKAITMHEMKISVGRDPVEIHVLVDI